MTDLARAALPDRNFSAQVQNLRQYMHAGLGWVYSPDAFAPSPYWTLKTANMIWAATGVFQFRGEVRGACYGRQDFSLTDVTASGGGTRTSDGSHTVEDFSAQFDANNTPNRGFQGVVLSLPHHTPFLGRTLIRRDMGPLNPKEVIELKRVGFVSSEFEKKFEVYSHDQVEARHLITPDFMERMNSFADDYLGRNLQVAFLNDHIHVCLDIDDRFDFSHNFNAFDFQEAATRILHEISSIFYLLEKVQTLQARIGAAGESGADKARGAYYKSLMDNLIPAAQAAKGKFKDIDPWLAEQRWEISHFDPMLYGLLRPRF